MLPTREGWGGGGGGGGGQILSFLEHTPSQKEIKF